MLKVNKAELDHSSDSKELLNILFLGWHWRWLLTILDSGCCRGILMC